MKKLLIAMLVVAAPAVAFAGPLVPLGVPAGFSLGITVGSALPIAGGGVLLVAAAGLGIGIRIARRKRK